MKRLIGGVALAVALTVFAVFMATSAPQSVSAKQDPHPTSTASCGNRGNDHTPGPQSNEPDSNGDCNSDCHTGSKGRGAGGNDKDGECDSTATATSTATPVTPTQTTTVTASATATATATDTPQPTVTGTSPTSTSTASPIATATDTPTTRATPTRTNTFVGTSTSTVTATPTGSLVPALPDTGTGPELTTGDRNFIGGTLFGAGIVITLLGFLLLGHAVFENSKRD